MNHYLLDTNICIYLFKGMFGISDQLESIGIESCFISEITVAELKYGAENSAFPQKNLIRIKQLQQLITVIPIFNAIDVYA